MLFRSEFRNLDLKKVKSLMRKPNFFDLRNVYDPQKMKGMGFRYFCVGRNREDLGFSGL